jgi:hypothetical protein
MRTYQSIKSFVQQKRSILNQRGRVVYHLNLRKMKRSLKRSPNPIQKSTLITQKEMSRLLPIRVQKRSTQRMTLRKYQNMKISLIQKKQLRYTNMKKAPNMKKNPLRTWQKRRIMYLIYTLV